MTDYDALVEELKTCSFTTYIEAARKAADAIRDLRAERDRYLEAAQRCADVCTSLRAERDALREALLLIASPRPNGAWATDIASAALAAQERKP